jgi:hypothetical protein
MGALTEVEIFDCMATNLAIAADCCDQMAVKPMRGVPYIKFREACANVEGACRQASQWREDTRWLPMGLMMEKCHQFALKWITGFKTQPRAPRVALSETEKHPKFVKMAENLRFAAESMKMLKDGKTGKIGMILPDTSRGPTRTQGRPVQVKLPAGMTSTPGGLIVPRDAA